MGKTLAQKKRQWLKERDYRAEYESQAAEFEVARVLIAARAGLSQEALAKKMGTTQSAIARIESGRNMPSMKTIKRYAEATGSRLSLELLPA